MRLKGKTALITAAGQGIGEATARAFAAEGATVQVGEVIGSVEAGAAAKPAAAISAASPMRPAGICVRMRPFCSSFSLSVIAVLINPGATQLTVMLRLPSSRASERVMPATPALAAQ